MLDHIASETFNENINMMVPWYLMASYAYYEESDPIFSDAFFDDMGKRMINEWDNINHFHKHLITVEDLDAGTYLGEYPERVKGGLRSLRQIYYTKSGTLRKKFEKKF